MGGNAFYYYSLIILLRTYLELVNEESEAIDEQRVRRCVMGAHGRATKASSAQQLLSENQKERKILNSR